MPTTLLDRRRFLLGLGATTALVMTGCNASAGAGSDVTAPTAEPTGFSWTDARGKTIDLPAVPTAVVAQSSAAAALWDFGFRVAGAYGELGTDADGKLGYQAGNLDLSKVTVIGKTYGEFDVEKYAAMSPELLIDLSFDDKTLWYVAEKSLAQVEKIGPTLGMTMLNLDLLQITQNFSKLAGALGADQSAVAVTDAKTAFEASAQRVREAVAANPGLTALGISRTADKAWIANAGQHPDFAYLEKLGVTFVPAGGKATDYFTEISYEQLDRYSADVIFDDARSPGTQQASDKVGVWQALPAVRAGQVHDWKAAAPYSYLAGAPIFADFAAAMTRLRPEPARRLSRPVHRAARGSPPAVARSGSPSRPKGRPAAPVPPSDPSRRSEAPGGSRAEAGGTSLYDQRSVGPTGPPPTPDRPATAARPTRPPLPGQRRAAVVPAGLLQLQRTAGNAAVRTLLAPPARTVVPVSVQRCGGVVHEGCSCVNEEAPPVGEGPTPATPSVDRSAATGDERNAPVQRFTDGTPDNPSTDLPDGSPYASMDAELLAMLGRTLTAKSFWRWRNDRPTNLGAALDGLGAADINTLVQLKRRCDMFGLWHNITTMTNLWTTSSLGIDFTGGGGMQGAVAGADQFCRDTAVGESYHPGKSCWREMVEPGTPGLHVCMPDSIHIDPHQTVDGKGWSWSWGSGGPEFGTSCTYSFLAFLGHMMDVEGHRPVNPFTHHGQIVSRINSLLPQLEQRVKEFPDISAQRDDLRALQTEMQAVAPILRRWSLQGKEGGDDAEARTVLGQLDSADTRISRADDAIRGSNGPDPPLLYSP